MNWEMGKKLTREQRTRLLRRSEYGNVIARADAIYINGVCVGGVKKRWGECPEGNKESVDQGRLQA